MKRTTVCLLFVLLTGCVGRDLAEEKGWKSLFNGHDFTGWSVKAKPEDLSKGFWRVEAGEIIADSMGAVGHDYVWLVTDQEYGDFVLRLEFQAFRDSPGNTGVQIRSRYDGEALWLDGPQVDINPPEAWRTGMIWDETRGNQRWLYPDLPVGEWVDESMAPDGLILHFADEEQSWNELEITAQGPHITAVLNGVQVTQYDGTGVLDDEAHQLRRVGTRGHIALQIHTGDQLKVHYRSIYLLETQD